ncbi:hypothetical protein SRABI98_00639 [Microbacterium sp. Bi98]|uniref:hypothetical protein n=1 Tax=unclassified Microbacterium TaxID=2609290 RepID=UPI0006FEA5D6|nr:MULTISPECIES: hypothetical protein [unclassified Microbacterium]KRD50541.1 hypothetical protein ASE34_13390 [Microbacterium sp. Root280D1]CAH0144980.1 hypothetical protein SRABI98_00639 [Microbacterium sp. Bi98]
MTIEHNPALLIERATTARITALQDTLRGLRQEHESAVNQRVHADVHRRHANNDGTKEVLIDEVGLTCG